MCSRTLRLEIQLMLVMWKSSCIKELSAHELEELRPIIKTSASPEGYQWNITPYFTEGFSLFILLWRKKRPSHLWNERSLLSLLKEQSGPCLHAVHLLKKHASGSVSNEIPESCFCWSCSLVKVAEVRDGEFELTNENVTKAIELLDQMDHTDELDHLLNVLLDHMIAKDTTHTPVTSLYKDLRSGSMQPNSEVAERRAFLNLSQVVFEKIPDCFRSRHWAELCRMTLRENTPSETEYISQVLRVHWDEPLRYRQRKMQRHFCLEFQLIETYGINRDRMDLASWKVSICIQTHEKFGVELVQTKLVQAFCYQAVKKKDTTLLKIAETLIVADEIPVKASLSSHTREQLLPIAKNRGKSITITLTMYQNHKQRIPSVHPSAFLPKCMMIASLYGNDREVCAALFEKLCRTRSWSDEMEMATMKKVFKVLRRRPLLDDSWESAEPRLACMFSRTIKNL